MQLLPKTQRRRFLIASAAVLTLVALTPFAGHFLRGSLTDNKVLILADIAPKDGKLSAREMRRSIVKMIQAIVSHNSEYDLDASGSTDRTDLTLLIASIRSFLAASCGNGLLETVEQCDDENTNAGDGCSASCIIEEQYACSGAPSVCTSYNDIVRTLADTNHDSVVDENESLTVTIGVAEATDKPYDSVRQFDVNNDGVIDGTDTAIIFTALDFLLPAAVRCGDGTRSPDEACDDGNSDSTDACSNTCTVAKCGDSIVNNGPDRVVGMEECDDGNTSNTDTCTNTCLHIICGDGLRRGNEYCDDGNTANGDGCTSVCQREGVSICTGEPSVCSACGDAVRDPLEQCDDGNTINGDGCNSVCVKEPGATCTGQQTSVCTVCGNAKIEAGEQCDDGNLSSTDACMANCKITVCGDGIKAGTEACDDGNTANSDGCSATCSVEPYATCFGGLPTVCRVCGNGTKEGDEQCDDHNNVAGDGCGATCRTEVCGNVAVDPGEECDLGSSNGKKESFAGVTCTAQCKIAFCGDGQNNTALEQCDDANTVNNDGCTNACKLPACLDGILQVGEQCDDGNYVNDDDCSNICKTTSCGDGREKIGEQCDDGNTINGDGCNISCALEVNAFCTSGEPSKCSVCGNGTMELFEQCDDGNTNNADACKNDCTLGS